MFLSETCYISDVLFFDSGANDNISLYDISPLTTGTISHNQAEDAYLITQNYNGRSGYITIDNLEVEDTIRLSCDFKLLSYGNSQPTLGVYDGNTAITSIIQGYQIDPHFFIAELSQITPSGIQQNTIDSQSYNWSINMWYTVELTINGASVSAKLYNADKTLLFTLGGESNSVGSLNNVMILFGFCRDCQMLFRNLCVQEL